jgi:hypothetical protein
MTIKTLFTICAIGACSLKGFAQSPFNASSISIKIKGDKTAIQAGEQVVLTAKGINEEIYSLQWQVSTDGTKWKDIPKATGTNYETASINETMLYRVVGRSNEGFLAVDDISSVQTVTVGDNVASTKHKKN